MNEQELITKLLWLFESQRFNNWYNNGDFHRFITGDMEHEEKISKEEANKKIREQIAGMILPK